MSSGGNHKPTYRTVADSAGTVTWTQTAEGQLKPMQVRKCDAPHAMVEAMSEAVRGVDTAVPPEGTKFRPPSSGCMDCGESSVTVCVTPAKGPETCAQLGESPTHGPVATAFGRLAEYVMHGCLDVRSAISDETVAAYLEYRRALGTKLRPLGTRLLDEALRPDEKERVASGALFQIELALYRSKALGPLAEEARNAALAQAGLSAQVRDLFKDFDDLLCERNERDFWKWVCSPEGLKATGTTPCPGTGAPTAEVADRIAGGKARIELRYGAEAFAAAERASEAWLAMLKSWKGWRLHDDAERYDLRSLALTLSPTWGRGN